MIHHSVVGKLWVTIIGLVSIILLFLSVFVIQYFDRYYYVEQSRSLTELGEKIFVIINKYPDQEKAIDAAKEILEAFKTEMVVTYVDEKGNFTPIDSLFTSEELEEITSSNQTVVRLRELSYIDYVTFNGSNDKLAVAIPLYEHGEVNKAIILYQTLNQLYQATDGLKKIVLVFAIIGIVMTTVFAFFLSTRITAPIRQMQKAANRMAKGDFNMRVNIVTTDEIGDLAASFNRMAGQLAETVQALSTEKDKLSNILSSMADGVITMNKLGEITVTNPPAEGFLVANTWELPEALKEMLKTVINLERNVQKDIHLSGRILAVVMAPLYSNRLIHGAVTLLRDVTYERKMNKLRRDFLANVSHELRTPISMLQGYSEAIIDDIAKSPEEKKEYAQIIYDESLRMGRLVNELLDLAKMESGNVQLELCKVDIKKMLEKMSHKYINITKEAGIILQLDINHNLNEVIFDADRIEQVLTNLIDNAIRHTPTGGEIILRARLTTDEKLLLEVEDSGEGIPEEDLPFIFERFYKADKARTRGRSGTGLGLSIVKNIVDAHRGKISVKSKPGQGTTFTIILPTEEIEK